MDGNTKGPHSPGSHLSDTECHQDREAELGEEDQEKRHEPHAGVSLERLIRGSEPAQERQGDKEDDVGEGDSKSAAVIQSTKQRAQGPEQVGQIQCRVY